MKFLMPCASSSSLQAGAPATTKMARPSSQLVGFGGERRVVVVRRADHDDVGFRLDGGAYPFLDAVEISVVLHANAGAGEEVARELGPGPANASAPTVTMKAFGLFPLRSTFRRICSKAIAPR